jgi:hypothetical protein
MNSQQEFEYPTRKNHEVAEALSSREAVVSIERVDAITDDVAQFVHPTSNGRGSYAKAWIALDANCVVTKTPKRLSTIVPSKIFVAGRCQFYKEIPMNSSSVS